VSDTRRPQFEGLHDPANGRSADVVAQAAWSPRIRRFTTAGVTPAQRLRRAASPGSGSMPLLSHLASARTDSTALCQAARGSTVGVYVDLWQEVREYWRLAGQRLSSVAAQPRYEPEVP